MNTKQPNDPTAHAEELPENNNFNKSQTPETTDGQLLNMKHFVDLLLQEVEKDSNKTNSTTTY